MVVIMVLVRPHYPVWYVPTDLVWFTYHFWSIEYMDIKFSYAVGASATHGSGEFDRAMGISKYSSPAHNGPLAIGLCINDPQHL